MRVEPDAGPILNRAPQSIRDAPGLTPPERVTVEPTERKELEDTTRFDMGLAFTAFCSACAANAAALKAAARLEADFANLILDIFLGFAAPGFANFAADRLLGLIAGRVASFAKVRDKTKPIYNFVSGAVDDYVPLRDMLTKSDVLKGIFTGTVKTAGFGMKAKAPKLFGDTAADQYLRALQTGFQVELSNLSKSLPSLSFKELIALSFVFDPHYANIDTYIKLVAQKTSRFKEQVSAIGLPTSGMGKTTLIRIAEDNRDEGGRLGLAVAERVKEQFTGQIGRFFFDWEFKAWVGTEMREMALARYREAFGDPKNIPVVNQLKVRNMDTD